ncbi:hypothetical protein IJZ97_06735 [bacterium]|nr:hypothetical protein [bacterium]
MSINAINLNSQQRFTQFRPVKTVTVAVQQEPSQKIKRTAAASSFIGMSIALAGIAKKQGFSLNPKVIRKTPIKDWAIFKINNKGREALKIEEPEILALASGSVAGGLIGGAISDKKNMKAKGREALTQIAGNVAVPVAFVGGTARIYNKYEDQIKSIMPQLKTNGKKSLEFINKFSKSIPALAFTGVALAAGIKVGSAITNLINEKMFGQKKKREIKTSDFAPHVDDLCLAITLMGPKESVIANSITRTVPLFLSVPGYQVGKAQEQI